MLQYLKLINKGHLFVLPLGDPAASSPSQNPQHPPSTTRTTRPADYTNYGSWEYGKAAAAQPAPLVRIKSIVHIPKQYGELFEAFMKGNKPFKNTKKELFSNFRWSLLPLASCAHKKARGTTKADRGKYSSES